jgi:hypothetical protein
MSEPKQQAPRRNYGVGYGKPPVHTRFRKGQSGNPSGRPRKRPSERAEEMILKETYRLVGAREGGSTVRIPALQAVLRAQIALAAKGNGPAQRNVLRMAQKIERERHEQEMKLLQTAIDYQENAARERHRMQQQGITEFDPSIPHPGDVEIAPDTLEVRLRLPGLLDKG